MKNYYWLKVKSSIKRLWIWLTSTRKAHVQHVVSVKYFSLEQQITFLKQSQALLSSGEEIILSKNDCDMLLNIEASLLTKPK